MISAKLTIQSTIEDTLGVFLDDFNQMVAGIGNEVTALVRPQMLDELQYTPPAVKLPIEWTSEKQQRAFFATDGFGRGIPTQRTGRLQGAWRVVGVSKNGRYQLVADNDTPYLPFVVGSVDFRSANRALAPMQRFHRNTGWQPIQNTLVFWFDVAQEEFNTRYDRTVREFSQGKTTRRTSRKG